MRSFALMPILVVVALIPVIFTVQARPPLPTDHPDFSGRWVLDLGRSNVHPVYFKDLTKGEVRIKHIDPAFSFSRTFAKAGQDEVVEFTLTTDGSEVEGNEDGMPTRSSLTWNGGELFFLTIYRTPRGEARNTVTYSLHDDGRTLRAEESFRGPKLRYDNVWVFSKVNGGAA